MGSRGEALSHNYTCIDPVFLSHPRPFLPHPSVGLKRSEGSLATYQEVMKKYFTSLELAGHFFQVEVHVLLMLLY